MTSCTSRRSITQNFNTRSVAYTDTTSFIQITDYKANCLCQDYKKVHNIQDTLRRNTVSTAFEGFKSRDYCKHES